MTIALDSYSSSKVGFHMYLIALADQIADVRHRIDQDVKDATLDKFQQQAFAFISERLDEMERECRTGKLKAAELRYAELARIAVETDPALLPPDLGGQLIDVERKYQRAR